MRRRAWRWHFLAALLVIPFVLWQSATGTLYLWSEAWVDHRHPDLRFVEPGPHQASLDAQVGAAREFQPGAKVANELPAIPGMQERWGRSVFHCPYCHGYELDQGRIGVIAASPMSVHQAQLLAEWGTVTFFLNETIELDDVASRDLQARGVAIARTPIAAVDGHADVVLADGRRLAYAGLFTAPKNAPATPLAEAMGCLLMETPMGMQVQTNDAKETSVPGVFACGDTARIPHSLSLAVGDGAWAGANLHRSLVWPDA